MTLEKYIGAIDGIEKMPVSRKNNPLSRFNRYPGFSEIGVEKFYLYPVIEKCPITGGGWKMDFLYKKRNGEHLKDSGFLNIRDLNGKKLAHFEVYKGSAIKLAVFSERFSKEIDYYQDLPIYDKIKRELI